MKYYIIYASIIISIVFLWGEDSCSLNRKNDSVQLNINTAPFEKISDYHFFKGAGDSIKPNNRVIAYKLVNSMFNDYSHREYFIYLPEGESLCFDETKMLSLPVGGCLVNLIYYYKNEKNISLGKRLVETQLLVRKQTEWEILDYVWSDDQKDAYLTEKGDTKSITWLDKNGLENHVQYAIPNKDECKHCHWYASHVTPIGIKAGNLNLDTDNPSEKKNQLDYWRKTGILKTPPEEDAVKYQNWTDTTLTLDERAKNYLETNCSFCHNPKGNGVMSGLFLNYDNFNIKSYGICKPVISAGMATCNLKYDIVPGTPAQSIMVCRMASDETGVKMPELGRTVVDSAGLEVITAWISQLKGGCSTK